MLLVKMDFKNQNLLAERNISIASIQPNISGLLSEAKVRELSKSLSSLRLKNDDALPDGFVRYTRSFPKR